MTINNSAAGILKFAATLVGNALLVCWLFLKDYMVKTSINEKHIFYFLSEQYLKESLQIPWIPKCSLAPHNQVP